MKHRLKYLLSFLTSVALTFHFLQSSRTLVVDGKRQKHGNSPAHGWTVLSGNVTVHVGFEASNVANRTAFKVDAKDLCASYDKKSAKFLIFVASKTENFVRRQTIRDTWAVRALQEALNFRVAFIIGTSDNQTDKVKEESSRYGDIVQIDIRESFRNLGRKSVAGLFWSAKYCSEADVIVKTDDDIFIHVPNLMNAVRQSSDNENLLLCRENRMQRILRKEELNENVPKNYDKYEVTGSELPGAYYPPYCSGMAYVMSRSVRGRLLQASLITPLFFIEDVYLTGFCRYKAGIDITPHPGITLRPPIESAQAPCVFAEGRITSHEVDVDELRELWAETNTQGFFCPQILGYARLPESNNIA